jgi:predicted hotdog family 3-hydroxylacyl-ACP dehydratase
MAQDEFFVPALGLPAYVGVEYMAQCVAAHAGARARVNGYMPPLGFLLGSRDYKSHVDYFELDCVYRARCKELIKSDDGMGAFQCEIVQGLTVVAEARLSVLEKQSSEKFIA